MLEPRRWEFSGHVPCLLGEPQLAMGGGPLELGHEVERPCPRWVHEQVIRVGAMQKV